MFTFKRLLRFKLTEVKLTDSKIAGDGEERHQTAAIYPSAQATNGNIMAASNGRHIPIYRTTIRYWTVHGHVEDFCNAIAKRAKEFIKFPETEQEVLQSIRLFTNKSPFPQVVGAIDSCHIALKTVPVDERIDYFNRKQDYSVVIQGVADASFSISRCTCSSFKQSAQGN